MGTYSTIAEPLEVAAITINGSRFLADVFPTTEPVQALAYADEVRARYPDASHHCWAYRLHEKEQIRPMMASLLEVQVVQSLPKSRATTY